MALVEYSGELTWPAQALEPVHEAARLYAETGLPAVVDGDKTATYDGPCGAVDEVEVVEVEIMPDLSGFRTAVLGLWEGETR